MSGRISNINISFMKGYYKLLILICIVALAACKRVNDPIGPEYKIPSSSFEILAPFAAINPSINFSLNEIENFTAAFSEKVTWKITLKGLSSGAVKVYNGFSKNLDATNTEWTGKHDGLHFFRTKEKVVASLTFLGSDLLYTDTIYIVYARNWDVPGQVITALTFEKGALSTEYTFFDGPFTPFPTYKATFANKGGVNSDMLLNSNNEIEKVLRDIDGDTIAEEIPGSIEGDKLYRMGGQDGIYTGSGYSDYFIGGAGLPSAPKGHLYDLDSNANNVYFNIYVYGTGDPNSKLVINFDEDDNLNDTADAGGQVDNYVIFEDEYSWGIQVDWKGWKLVSTKYSDLQLSADGVKAKSKHGNGIQEPHLISKIGFVLLSTAKGGKASVRFDFATFTMGKPFNPNE
jgi:hypothetical protein